jgi:2-oxoisovalerate dehydrogenase E1 component alpha subunit
VPLDPTLARRALRVVLTTRAVDERFWILARQGRAGFVLTPRGHEVAQVLSVAAMRRGLDWAWPYYRDLGVGLALGVTPYELFLTALARADDPHSGGRQLSSHLSSPSLRIGSVSSEVAAHVPHAVGTAYASWVRRDDAVSVCWLGDGATSEGAVHEAMNLAGVHDLPVVFVCENNGWAISVPAHRQLAVPRFADRAAAYGMPGVTVDGCDAGAVLDAMRAAITRARRRDGPSVVEVLVPRITPHSSQDDDGYRTEADVAAAAALDPVARLRSELVAARVVTEGEVELLDDRIRAAVAAAAQRAVDAPEPHADRARRWLYAGDEPHGYRTELDAAPPPPGVFADDPEVDGG